MAPSAVGIPSIETLQSVAKEVFDEYDDILNVSTASVKRPWHLESIPLEQTIAIAPSLREIAPQHPNSTRDFRERLQGYRPLAYPYTSPTPVECARFGWKVVDGASVLLKCVSCGAEIRHQGTAGRG